METGAQVLVMTPASDKIQVSVQGVFVKDHTKIDGYRAPSEFKKATSPSGHTDFNTARVNFLSKEESLPVQFISQIPVGPKEFFATQANLRHGGVSTLTAAFHFMWAPRGVMEYNVILGGPQTSVTFQLKSFLGLDTRDQGADTAEVSFSFDPASVDFISTKSVSSWQNIKSAFPDIHLNQGAMINLDEIMVRFRIRSNLTVSGDSNPTLLLEALVVKDGTWDAVPDTKKMSLSGATASSILLWSAEVEWFSPCPDYRLPTSAGIARSVMGFAMPGEFQYRWAIQVAMIRSDYGKSVSSKEEFEAYWEETYPTYSSSPVEFWLPDPFPEAELTARDPGRTPRAFVFSRNGKTIVRKAPTGPKPIKPSKFNTLPGKIVLGGNALPTDAPANLKVMSQSLFNASVSGKTAKGYEGTERKIKHLEAQIGRTFRWPLDSKDLNLFVAHLVSQKTKNGKRVKPGTIKKHMSGIRRIALSKGIPTPDKIPDLTKTLLKGHKNLCHDPQLAVDEATHRPVSIPLLRLIGHSLSKHWEGTQQDKLTFWTICKVAFWGSFRVGEILSENTTIFSPKSDMLGSDMLWMSDSSFALWIRDPKIRTKYGDVIEIWKTQQIPDLDPWISFAEYWKWRQQFPPTWPLFLRADGLCFSHSQFSGIMKDILAHYSRELQLDMNQWTGHDFRSGLPTVLQTAGFSDEEIKKWGRWASSAFMLYTRDYSQRLRVQEKMLGALDRLKSAIAKRA